MKKIIALLSVLILTAFLVTGCGSGSSAGSSSHTEDSGLKIVTTIFPEYDWTRNILGDSDADLTLLVDNGTDLHSFQPSADDIITISTCDVFIYVGGSSDTWVEDALENASNENMRVINLMDVLGDTVKEEETVEGMQAEAEEDEGIEYDEHIWLSLRNAETACRAIADELCSADEDNAELYRANADAYIEKLNSLDAEYQAAADSASCRTLLFGDRFPFRYMTDDYGLEYYAAFAGCSAESEASFETISFLAGKADELGLTHIITLENSSSQIAETVSAASADKSAEILQMDSMQSVSAADIDAGADYISIMEKNLEVLKKALS